MARKQIGIKLDEELLARVDEAVEAAGSSRTDFIELALKRLLGWSERNEVQRRALMDPAAFAKPEKYTASQLEERRRMYRARGWELADFSDRTGLSQPQPPKGRDE